MALEDLFGYVAFHQISNGKLYEGIEYLKTEFPINGLVSLIVIDEQDKLIDKIVVAIGANKPVGPLLLMFGLKLLTKEQITNNLKPIEEGIHFIGFKNILKPKLVLSNRQYLLLKFLGNRQTKQKIKRMR